MDDLYDKNIISDILSLSSDIKFQKKNKFIPEFLFNKIKSRQIDKLIKSIDKLRVANKPLNNYNLYEFFRYIYTSYLPNGEYRNIKYTKLFEDNSIESYIELKSDSPGVNDTYYTIKVYPNIDSNIEIKISNRDQYYYQLYTIEMISLETSNKIHKKYVNDLNKSILEDIRYYLLENI